MNRRRMIAGTAQLTGSYGALGVSVEQSGDDPHEFVKSLQVLGFDAIDTAPTYLGAEQLIGNSNSTLEVHTKIDPKLGPRASLQQSLRRLCRASVDVLYFHDPDAVLTGSGEVIRTALPLRESGEALALGTSVYSIDALRASLTHPHIDVVQIPVNPLQPSLAALAQNKQGKQIFGRSLLAQGLLTTSPENLPPSTAHLEPSITAFQSACNELGRTPLEVALLWSRDHPSLDGLIIGAASIAQLRETSTILSSPSLSLEERALLDAVNQPTGATMDPRTWR